MTIINVSLIFLHKVAKVFIYFFFIIVRLKFQGNSVKKVKD